LDAERQHIIKRWRKYIANNLKFVLLNKYYENDETYNESAFMEEMRSE
jgi:hypothetical protein